MPEEIKDDQETTEVQDAIDLDDSESRMTFLKSQLNELLDGINSSYGQELMEELLKRLEKTVENYNGEVSGLMGKLKSGKIFEDDSEDDDLDEPSMGNDRAEADDDAEVDFEDQEAEDADVIARMRARITHE